MNINDFEGVRIEGAHAFGSQATPPSVLYATIRSSRLAAVQECETRKYPCMELTILKTGRLALV